MDSYWTNIVLSFQHSNISKDISYNPYYLTDTHHMSS